jgi:hypothetical protein
MPESVMRLQLPNVCFRTLDGVAQHSQLAIAYRHNEAAPAIRAFICEVHVNPVI